MAVTQLSRYKGGKPEEMTALAKQAKAMWEQNGAEYFRLSKFYTGPWVGEWLVVIRFAGWAEYGKAVDSMAKNQEFQSLLSRVLGIAEMTGRNITVGIDL